MIWNLTEDLAGSQGRKRIAWGQPGIEKHPGCVLTDDKRMISSLGVVRNSGSRFLISIDICFGGINIQDDAVYIGMNKLAGLLHGPVDQKGTGITGNAPEETGD